MNTPLLLIDAGNTRLKWATALAGGTIRPGGNIPTAQANATRINALARRFSTHRAVLACVVPKLVPLFRSAFSKRLVVLTAKTPGLPFAFDYPRPGELGADRLAAAAAVHAERKFPAIIVGCGTACAFTVLDRRGRLCGGAISPGLQTQLAALIGTAAQLPRTSLQPTRRLPARSTQEAIRAGVMLTFLAGTREIVERLAESLKDKNKPRIFLTGGDASLAQKALGPGAEVRPLLVFEGLRIIAERRVARKP